MIMRATANGKAATAYRTISEVAEELGVQQHVLRFWETRFPQIRPVKRGGGRRYYRPEDIAVLRRIRTLLYDEGYTIKGALTVLKTERRAQSLQSATAVNTAEAGGPGTGDLFGAIIGGAPAPEPSVAEKESEPEQDPAIPEPEDELRAETREETPAADAAADAATMIPREPLMALLHELRWLRAGINLKR